MTAHLRSSAPAIFDALQKLAEEAAPEVASAENWNETPTVLPFGLNMNNPGRYVLIEKIANHHWEWASIGEFAQEEKYELRGRASVFSGDSPATNPALPAQVMADTYALFEACVMDQVMTNRNEPMLNYVSAGVGTVFSMLPAYADYEAKPGGMAGGNAGWSGTIDWGFAFRAYVAPS